MKVFKVMDAVDCVYECINSEDYDLEWDDVSDLIRKITDRHMESSFDCIICHEFPNGVDINEFIEFVRDKQDFIYSELGIDADKNN